MQYHNNLFSEANKSISNSTMWLLRCRANIRTASLFILIFLLNILCTIISGMPFLKRGNKQSLLAKIVGKGRGLYIKLGPMYHIGIRSNMIPSKFRVKLYPKVDNDRMEKIHQELQEGRKQLSKMQTTVTTKSMR